MTTSGTNSIPGLDRRRFLLVASAALGALGTGHLLTACGGNPNTPLGDGQAPKGVAFDPGLKPGDKVEGVIYNELYPNLPSGGSLNIGISQKANTLDILSSALGAVSWMADPAHDFLERYDHRGFLVPSLASSVEMLDNVTYRYTLRDAVFHNDRPVTAEDVRKTFAYVLDPANASPRRTLLKGAQVNVVDDKTVEIKLPAPDAGFRHQLPRIPIVPLEAMSTMAIRPVGCGPFLFSNWVQGSHVEYRKNPKYWNPQAPRVDNLRLTLLADATSGTQAFAAGQFDFLDSVATPQIPTYLANTQIKSGTLEPGWIFLAVNHAKPPFDDVRVRKAINLALDRAKIAQVATPQLAKPMWTAPMTPTQESFYPKNLDFARNVDQARALLRDAGHASDITATVFAISPVSETIATVVKSNLADIGVQLNIQRIDLPAYNENLIKGAFDLSVSGWFTTPEPSAALDALFRSGAASNYWKYSSPKADAALEQLRTTFQAEDRVRIYADAVQEIFIDNPAIFPLTTQATLFAYRPNTNGEQYRPDPGPLWHYPIAARRP